MTEPRVAINTRTRRDLLIIGVVVILICLAIAADPDRLFEIVAQRRAVQLDEFLVAIVVVGSGFAIFSWRRWTELTRQIAEYKRLQTELTNMNRDAALMSETDDLLQSCLSVDEAYTVVIRHLETQFEEWSGAVGAITTNRDAVEIAAHWGEPVLVQDVFPTEDCWSLRRGRMSVSRTADPKLVCNHIGLPNPNYGICVPMMAQGETLGILYLDSGKNPGAAKSLTESQERTIKTLAEHLALTLAGLNLREKLKMQAIRDPLTDLFNRRYMEESLDRELRRAARRSAPLSVLMVDVDNFKQFNDSHGHEAGDVLLQEISRIFRANLRAEDIPCRYGGEEFTLILAEAALGVSVERAERLRQAVAELEMDYRGQRLPKVTISIGVSCYPGNGDSVDSLLRAADRCLYQAKRDGRDRVVAAAAEPIQLLTV